ncbi:MAG: LysM peptidoglycan-binding domain-containing protein [Nostocoides sp.]|jgi:LysM repeat protein
MAPLFTMPATPPPLFDLPALAHHSTSGQEHTVRAGETVYGLAITYGTSTGAIARANNLSNSRLIHPGDVLVIPSGEGATTKRPARALSAHTVRTGETLSAIAVRYSTTVAALAKANGVAANGFIYPGQKLNIPGSVSRVDRSYEATPKKSPVTRMASRSATRDLIAATALRYGVDPKLALAISWQESGWQQGVSSHVGAVGAMQVMPDSGTWAGSLIGRDLNLHDVNDNVTAGVVIIKQLTKMAANRDEVIAAYYQGLGSVRERGWYRDTRQYVANVNYFRGRF